MQALNRSDGKPFSLRPLVVVHDAGTVVYVESRGRLVGARWARAVREGGASVSQSIGRSNPWEVGVHVVSFGREIFHLSDVYRR